MCFGGQTTYGKHKYNIHIFLNIDAYVYEHPEWC